MKQRAKQTGFTIVELLIVIVVIAILAAISIIAYNGIQSRANVASSLTTLNNYVKTLRLIKADTGTLPTTNACLGPVAAYPSGCADAGQTATSQASFNSQLASYGMASQPQITTSTKYIMYAYGFYGYDIVMWRFPVDQDCGLSPVLSPNGSNVWGMYGSKYSLRTATDTFCAVVI